MPAMNRFRLLPNRLHGLRWVMLVILALHAVAPHGHWRPHAGGNDLGSGLAQLDSAQRAVAGALGLICSSQPDDPASLPAHDSDALKCQAVAPPPSLAVAMPAAQACGHAQPFAPVAIRRHQDAAYAHPWPNAPPALRA